MMYSPEVMNKRIGLSYKEKRQEQTFFTKASASGKARSRLLLAIFAGGVKPTPSSTQNP